MELREPTGKYNDLTGKTYDYLYVKGLAGVDSQGRTVWDCECQAERNGKPCGNTVRVRGRNLVVGTSFARSCGCVKHSVKDRIGNDIYMRWQRLRKAGRLCEEWAASVEVFYAAVGRGEPGYALLPIDGNVIGPGNFQWRSPLALTINGQQTSLTKLAQGVGISRQGLKHRISHYGIEHAIKMKKRGATA